jgi:hypothetical protein
VEHACHQCGSLVEDGRPFCSHCRAPQIHVRIAEPAAIAHVNSASDAFSSDTFEPLHLTRDTTTLPSLDRKVVISAAVKAGLLGFFIGIIPLLGFVLTGALSIFFYRRENGTVPTPALGARLGGAAGIITFAINALLMSVRIFVFHNAQEYIDMATKMANRFGADVNDPAFQSSIHSLVTPAGLAITFFFAMLMTVLFSALGGALGSIFLRPSKPHE